MARQCSDRAGDARVAAALARHAHAAAHAAEDSRAGGTPGAAWRPESGRPGRGRLQALGTCERSERDAVRVASGSWTGRRAFRPVADADVVADGCSRLQPGC